jgi:uncharacterized phage-associated protein
MHAWNYGPVEIGLYKLFSIYKEHPIPTNNVYKISTDVLDEKQIEVIKRIVDEMANEKAWDLVEKTHEENSRWYPHRNNLGAEIKFI